MQPSQLDGLDTFARVAEYKSFSRAAEAIGASKAHVSRQITRLEARLGVQLFRRSTRSVVLTTQGEMFYLRVRDSLALLDDAEHDLAGFQAVPRGNLRMTVAGVFGEKYLAPAVAEFLRVYPEINVLIDFTDRQVDLINEDYDLAIRSGVLEDSSLIARRITSRKIITCASPEYLQQHSIPQKIEDLKHHNCLIGSIPFWHFKDKNGKHRHVSVSGNWQCNNGYALLQAARHGVGIVQLPEFYLHETFSENHLCKVLDAFQPTENAVWAVYPKNRYLPPKVRLFVAFLRDRFADPM